MTEQEKRDKVIRGLECCGYAMFMDKCQECPYDGKDCFKRLKADALALLKAQEPVEPTIGRCEEYDGHDSWWYQCGKCKTPIDVGDKYCRMCGREVKWE